MVAETGLTLIELKTELAPVTLRLAAFELWPLAEAVIKLVKVMLEVLTPVARPELLMVAAERFEDTQLKATPLMERPN